MSQLIFCSLMLILVSNETYFDVVYKRMGVGSTIIADDVVASENELADYTTYVQNHPSLESVTLPLSQGLEFTVRTAD